MRFFGRVAHFQVANVHAEVVQEALLVVVADVGKHPVPRGPFRPKVAGRAVGCLVGNRGEHSLTRRHDGRAYSGTFCGPQPPSAGLGGMVHTAEGGCATFWNVS